MRLIQSSYYLQNHLPHHNQKCIIFASGPSILDFDFSSIDESYDICCVNGAIAILQEHQIKPNYYCVVDTGFLKNRQLFIAGIKACDYFFTTTYFWRKTLRKFLFQHYQKYIFIRHEPVSLEQSIEKNVFIAGGTVVTNAIQCMLMLNYQEIYLVGMDLNNQPRAYHENHPAPSYLVESFESVIQPFFEQLKNYPHAKVYNLSMNSRLSGEIIAKIPRLP